MVEVNCIGQKCPLPLINAKKALTSHPGESIRILVDNDISCNNLKTYFRDNSISFNLIEEKDLFILQTGDDVPVVQLSEVEPYCNTSLDSGYIVVLDTDEVGKGDKELGQILMKGFLTALSEFDQIPQEIICYNKGVLLASRENEMSEYMERIISKGIKISLCGTCVDYYGIKEKLVGGNITNMLYILEKLSSNSKIVKP